MREELEQILAWTSDHTISHEGRMVFIRKSVLKLLGELEQTDKQRAGLNVARAGSQIQEPDTAVAGQDSQQLVGKGSTIIRKGHT